MIQNVTVRKRQGVYIIFLTGYIRYTANKWYFYPAKIAPSGCSVNNTRIYVTHTLIESCGESLEWKLLKKNKKKRQDEWPKPLRRRTKRHRRKGSPEFSRINVFFYFYLFLLFSFFSFLHSTNSLLDTSCRGEKKTHTARRIPPGRIDIDLLCEK